MDFKSLVYVITIAQEGSISAAAQRLFISQSSLSLFLKNFEKQLDCVLFKRSTHGLKLTYEGERFIDVSNQMLSMWDRLKNEIKDLNAQVGGRVKFGVSSYRSPFVVPYVVSKLKETNSKIELNTIEAVSPVLEEMLTKGTLDVAVLALPIVNSMLKTRVVGNEEILICGKAGDPVFNRVHYNCETGKRWLDIDALENVPLILMQPGQGLNKFASELFAKRGLLPNAVYKTYNLRTAIQLAVSGIGLTFVPQLELYRDKPEGLEYASIGDTGHFRQLALVYPVELYLSKATEAISDMVEEALLYNNQTFNKKNPHEGDENEN